MNPQHPRPFKNVEIYLVIGVLIGFAILHPVSMLIDVEHHGMYHSSREFFQHWFSRPHRMMSLYFTVLGGAETWVDIEHYIAKRSNADFTHSICPDCLRLLYPEYGEKGKEP